LPRLRIRSLDDRPLPLQVDGDYIGDVDQAAFAVVPGGLLVVA
jgi:diacylglycerol kinase family enzyme